MSVIAAAYTQSLVSAGPLTLHPAGCRYHPGTNGHTALAELLLGPVMRALEEAAAGVRLKSRGAGLVEPLPPPMISTLDGTSSVCKILASCCRWPTCCLYCCHPCANVLFFCFSRGQQCCWHCCRSAAGLSTTVLLPLYSAGGIQVDC